MSHKLTVKEIHARILKMICEEGLEYGIEFDFTPINIENGYKEVIEIVDSITNPNSTYYLNITATIKDNKSITPPR